MCNSLNIFIFAIRNMRIYKSIVTIGLLLLVLASKVVFAGDKEFTLPPAIILPIDSIKIYDSLTFWKFEGRTRLNIQTVFLSDWADGGESSVSGAMYFDMRLKYEKGNFKFENFFNTSYGMQLYRYSNSRKTEDKFKYTTSVAHQFKKNWFYNAQAEVKSQYSKGYKYPNDSVEVSDFFAPGYLTISLGIENESIKGLSIFVSPIAGKLIFVMNQDLADEGKFGVKKAEKNADGEIITPGENLKAELGVNVKLRYRQELFKNVDLSSYLVLYNNYADPDPMNRWNIDVDWETLFDFTINRYFVANLYIHMIYDHNTKIPVYEVVDGDRTEVGETKKLQIKQNYGLGLAFKF